MKQLLREVCSANRDLETHRLVTGTWGNVSGFDRRRGIVVIKPSGVAYRDLRPELMVAVDLAGRVVQGALRPSTDLATHLALYQAFAAIGGVTHTHSTYATMFAQACQAIPCLGTTHADYFHGPVPVTRALTRAEVARDYERNTGAVIVARFARLSPQALPGVLVAHHGPFTWGKTAADAVKNSVVLESVAHMALMSVQLAPKLPQMDEVLLDRHFCRKHGPAAYYGQ